MTKVVVIQAASFPFEAMKSIDKACEILKKVASNGAKIAVFPEAFIGGYPKGSHFGSVVGNRSMDGRKLYQKYVEGAVSLDGQKWQGWPKPLLKRGCIRSLASSKNMVVPCTVLV